MRPAARSNTLLPGAAEAGSAVSLQVTCWPCANTADARKTSSPNKPAIADFISPPPELDAPKPEIIPSIYRLAPAQLLFDLLVHFPVGELGRHANRVLDGVGVASSVADDASAADAQQRRPAVFGIVHALLESRKRA